MDGVHLRLAREDDADPISALLSDAVLTSRAHFGTEPPSAADVRTQWESTRETHPWVVAEGIGDRTGERFLGFAKASRWIPRAGYTWTAETSVYLVESARGHGLGAVLYRRLFEVLRAQGYAVAIAGVAAGNPASVKLHQAMGMRRIGTLDPAGYKLGAWTSVTYYHKVLSEGALAGEPGALRPVREAWASTT